MIEFNKILSDGIWGTICSFINANFEKIRIELLKLTHSSIYNYNKGYYSSEIKLLNRYPKPEIGWYAFVGNPWPGKVYECTTAEKWTNTGIAPVIGDEVFIQMLKYYIDNDTIYWDDAKKVIKAKGGSGSDPVEETFAITVSINPGDIGKCDVGATGDYLRIVPSADGSTYTVTTKKGGTVTVNILSGNGYTVSQLNVDKVSHGTADSYTFKNVTSNHTMYVWMKEDLIEQDVTDFLERSDMPGVYYSAIGVALEAVKSAYPDGLTKDVTISCIKKATEVRSSQFNSKYGIWVASLENWNKDSFYTLTIDGKNQYTINCKWLGGLQFNNVDNIIFKNFSMKNYCNFSGQYVPEELSAIMVRGSDANKVKNHVMYNCKFDGFYQNTAGYRSYTWYCLKFKKTANLVVDSCDFKKAAAVVLSVSGVESIEITRSNLQGEYYYDASGLGHAYLMEIGSVKGVLKLHDNVIDGVTMKEYACSFSGFSTIDMRRNVVKDSAGQVFSIDKTLNEFVIESNVFYGNITAGLYSYTRRIFGCSTIKKLDVRNNTVYFDGEFSSAQEFLSGNIDKLVNYNNIFINKLGKASAVFKVVGVKEYISGNNLYASNFYNDKPIERFGNFRIVDATNNNTDEGYENFDFETRKLAEFQKRGYEANSVAIDRNTIILDDGYKLLSSLQETYPSKIEYQAEFDKEYLKADNSSANIGAYNLAGSVFDESSDTSVGYSGVNIADSAAFTNSAAYRVPTDDILLLHINTKKRGVLFKSTFTPQTGASILRYGQIITVALSCVANGDMFANDNPYSLTIEDNNYE